MHAAASTFAQRVRRARIELGLDQRSFAKRLGVSAATVTRWETGKSAHPRPLYLQRLSRLTQRPIDYFTDGISDEAL